MLLESDLNGVSVADLSFAFDEPSERGSESKGSHRIFHIKVHGEDGDSLRTDDPLYYKFFSRDFASR